MRRSFSRSLAASLLLLVLASPGYADDTADEADLKFNLGAEAYQRGEYRTALEHFLASNRLAPNHNVLYNIARCFEQLKQYPEAHRYYTQVLDSEVEPDNRSRIQAALAKIRQYVAVLE